MLATGAIRILFLLLVTIGMWWPEVSCSMMKPHGIHDNGGGSGGGGGGGDGGNGEHISLRYFAAMEEARRSKMLLQRTLYRFPENLQRNLTTSSLFGGLDDGSPGTSTGRRHRRRQLHALRTFFRSAADLALIFSGANELFFDAMTNESHSLVMALRQLPSGPRPWSTAIKSELDDYFGEMEALHVAFAEIVGEALEYIVDVMATMHGTFSLYADIQDETLAHGGFDSIHDADDDDADDDDADDDADEWCYSRYMSFLQHWSMEIFECAAGSRLRIAYDVYAMTELTAMHLLRQLEFRIRRAVNCLLHGQYEIHCRFLRQPTLDVARLLAKLDELQSYYDIKINWGRVPAHRQRKRDDEEQPPAAGTDAPAWDKCIPAGFPRTKMDNELSKCFTASDR